MNRFRISTVIFIFTLLISGRVFSQTNYDFSWGYHSVTEGGIGGSLTGTLTSTASNGVLDGISNLVFQGIAISSSNITSGSTAYGSFLSDSSYGYYDGASGHMNFQFANPLSTSPSVGSYVSVYTCNSTNASIGCVYSVPLDSGQYFTSRFNDQFAIGLNIFNPVTYAGDKSFTISSGYSGAPEIDGSLAPKVGFLLGCLFLMFGRKKEKSEDQVSWLSNQLT